MKAVAPMPHILFGTDFPYLTAAPQVKGLVDSKVFSAEELAAIEWENFRTLIPRYTL